MELKEALERARAAVLVQRPLAPHVTAVLVRELHRALAESDAGEPEESPPKIAGTRRR
jgi:hypothetical protein